jgi:hypothetical protein
MACLKSCDAPKLALVVLCGQKKLHRLGLPKESIAKSASAADQRVNIVMRFGFVSFPETRRCVAIVAPKLLYLIS